MAHHLLDADLLAAAQALNAVGGNPHARWDAFEAAILNATGKGFDPGMAQPERFLALIGIIEQVEDDLANFAPSLAADRAEALATYLPDISLVLIKARGRQI